MKSAALSQADTLGEARDWLILLGNEEGVCTRARIAEVSESIDVRGTYEMTVGELTMAAKIAWRNNARCIGRLFWRSLRVLDQRQVSTARGVFEACLEHLEVAFNGGRLRPLASVFAPGIRIWNHQLSRYAGYEEPGGTVLGDPASVDLTRQALELGWRGDRTGFDLLPLIIQMPGEPPQLFEIPCGVVHEVRITHRDLPLFEEMGLRWYAVPIISDMCLDAGGIRYTAAPFSGWYMNTEIASRNLADAGRYDLLPRIAKGMGLDTSHPRTMWQERALVELNAAVLQSFETARVTMVDQHTASAEFARFVELEVSEGRCAWSDRDWIVPPLSPARCPTWSMKHVNQTHKPNYFYQQAPWA